MLCTGCHKEAPACDLCGVQFDIDDDIICMEGGDEHLCETCLDGWLREQHNWSKATIGGKEK